MTATEYPVDFVSYWLEQGPIDSCEVLNQENNCLWCLSCFLKLSRTYSIKLEFHVLSPLPFWMEWDPFQAKETDERCWLTGILQINFYQVDGGLFVIWDPKALTSHHTDMFPKFQLLFSWMRLFNWLAHWSCLHSARNFPTPILTNDVHFHNCRIVSRELFH